MDVDFAPLIELAAEVGLAYHLGGGITTNMLTSRTGLRPGMRVLEVGCATGRTAAHIANTIGCDIVALDAHPQMLTWARREVDRRDVADRVEVVHADARDLPFADDSFDRVICESLLVFVDDPALALREMVRVVKPGGLVGCNEGTLTRRVLRSNCFGFGSSARDPGGPSPGRPALPEGHGFVR